MEWDADQQRVLAHERGALLVLGAPGTGKTSLLVERVARRMRAGEQPPALVLCLSRQAASEVRDRVVAASGRTSVQPSAMTLHSFCLGLLSRWVDEGDAPPRLLTAPEQEFRIRELLTGREAGLWPASFEQAVGTRAFASQVRGALARARQLGLDPLEVARMGAAAGEPAWVSLGEFADEYLDVLDAEQALDYAELVHRTRILLTRPDVLDAVRREFGALYVDEFAELDPAQIGLVRALAPEGSQVIAFADPDTGIYRFRGAHPRATAEFVRLFGADVAVLGTRHRGGERLASAAARVARRLGAPALEAGAVDAYRGAHASARGGRVEALTFPDEPALTACVAAELRAAHLDEGVPWADMAVVVRSGRGQIPPLSRALADAGIPVEVAGDEVGLASELAVRPLLLGLEIACRGGACDADEASRLLTSGWGGLDAVALRTLGRALRGASDRGRGRTSGELIAEALGGGWEQPGPLEGRAAEVVGVLTHRSGVLAEAAAAVAAGRRPDEVLWILWSSVPWPDELRATALGGRDAAPRADRDLDAVVALFELARSSQAPSGEGGVRAFLAEVAAQQIPADMERESAVRGRGVRLLTAHRAKGRQWRMVVVAGAQEGTWPDVRRRGSLLDPERLTNAGLGPGIETRDLVAGERRLFHLACSRASERLLVVAVAGTEGEADQPSRFVAELGVPVRHVVTAPARLHTLRALVGSLRATVQDPAAGAELREAAAMRLARLADARDDDGRRLVADAEPERWWGLRQPTSEVAVRLSDRVTLSPSQLEAVLACPRRFFLQREARAEPPRASAAILGSVIHALAEHVASEGLSRDEALAALHGVWDRIPFPAPWFSASEKVEAELALDRLLVWQEAHDYAEVLGVEVPFSTEVEVDGRPVRITGAVDRLEREASGAVRVVDFKSSRQPPTRAEAEANDQLGLYQVAVEAGAFGEVGAGSTSGGGALVYLRVDDGNSYPKVLGQPSLSERPHLSDDPEELAYPTWVHHRIARARDTLAAGRYDATPGPHCRFCAFRSSCPAMSKQVIA